MVINNALKSNSARILRLLFNSARKLNNPVFGVPKSFGFQSRCNSIKVENGPWNVLFFGTDDFALESLKILHDEYRIRKSVERLEVVTVCKGKENPIARYARQSGLVINEWPLKKDGSDFHIGVVVSFGHMIPSSIINMFPLGMINVHASLLPRWRGGAPIIYALMNGDTRTGITIMKIMPKKFDIGDIIKQKAVDIKPNETMPELSERLRKIGANLLVETMRELPTALQFAKPQNQTGVTYAPKVTAKESLVKWDRMNADDVYNLYRALVGFLPLTTKFQDNTIKLFEIKKLVELEGKTLKDLQNPGHVQYDKKENVLIVCCKDNSYVTIKKVTVPGRPCMSARDFNNGFIAGHRQRIVFFQP